MNYKMTSAAVLAIASGQLQAGPEDVLGDVIAILEPATPVSESEFGAAVAINGNRVIVGSPGINSAFEFDVSDLSSPTQIVQYMASDPGRKEFGGAVAVSGTLVAVGDLGVSETSGDSGFPRVSFYNAGSSILNSYIEDDNFSSKLGSSLSLNGTDLLAGAPDDTHNTIKTGSAWFIDTTDNSYSVSVIPEPLAGDQVGQSVALNDSFGAAGAPQKYIDGEFLGAVELFSSTGSFIREIVAQDADPNDLYGWSVGISANNTLIVGAPGDDETATNSGAAYLVDANNGNQLYKFVSTSATPSGDEFGHAVFVTDNYALVGAPMENRDGTDWGALYIFDVTDGSLLKKIRVPSSGGFFGSSIAADGRLAVVGDNSGRAYVIDLRCNIADFSAPFGIINNFDNSAFLAAFNAEDPSADLNDDGLFNFFDITLFLNAFGAGCP